MNYNSLITNERISKIRMCEFRFICYYFKKKELRFQNLNISITGLNPSMTDQLLRWMELSRTTRHENFV